MRCSVNNLIRKINYSEEMMACAFRELICSSNGIPRIGTFDAVYREVSCGQGRPDFLAIRGLEEEGCRYSGIKGIVAPSVMQCLKPRAPRSLSYIIGQIGFSRRSIEKAIKELLKSGYIESVGGNCYRLGEGIEVNTAEIWAFELKLNNARRAVFQAQQSRLYARRAMIVVPPGREKDYDRYIQAIIRWKIGLATFDPITKEFNIIIEGKNAESHSKSGTVYAISQLSKAYKINMSNMNKDI